MRTAIFRGAYAPLPQSPPLPQASLHHNQRTGQARWISSAPAPAFQRARGRTARLASDIRKLFARALAFLPGSRSRIETSLTRQLALLGQRVDLRTLQQVQRDLDKLARLDGDTAAWEERLSEVLQASDSTQLASIVAEWPACALKAVKAHASRPTERSGTAPHAGHADALDQQQQRSFMQGEQQLHAALGQLRSNPSFGNLLEVHRHYRLMTRQVEQNKAAAPAQEAAQLRLAACGREYFAGLLSTLAQLSDLEFDQALLLSTRAGFSLPAELRHAGRDPQALQIWAQHPRAEEPLLDYYTPQHAGKRRLPPASLPQPVRQQLADWRRADNALTAIYTGLPCSAVERTALITAAKQGMLRLEQRGGALTSACQHAEAALIASLHHVATDPAALVSALKNMEQARAHLHSHMAWCGQSVPGHFRLAPHLRATLAPLRAYVALAHKVVAPVAGEQASWTLMSAMQATLATLYQDLDSVRPPGATRALPVRAIDPASAATADMAMRAALGDLRSASA